MFIVKNSTLFCYYFCNFLNDAICDDNDVNTECFVNTSKMYQFLHARASTELRAVSLTACTCHNLYSRQPIATKAPLSDKLRTKQKRNELSFNPHTLNKRRFCIT